MKFYNARKTRERSTDTIRALRRMINNLEKELQEDMALLKRGGMHNILRQNQLRNQ